MFRKHRTFIAKIYKSKQRYLYESTNLQDCIVIKNDKIVAIHPSYYVWYNLLLKYYIILQVCDLCT